MRNTLLLSLILLLTACKGPLGHTLQRGQIPPKYTRCTMDTQCHHVPDTINCCTGCGVSYKDFVAVNSEGYRERKKRHEEQCGAKKCTTHFICPIRRSCKSTTPVCREHHCAIKVTDVKGCTPTK